MTEPVRIEVNPEDEAEAAFKFYDRIMQLTKGDTRVAETLTTAYIQSFERRLG